MIKMNFKIIFQIILIIALVLSVKIIYAQTTTEQIDYFSSYFKAGDFCINFSFGYLFGFCCNFGMELIIFENFIGKGPIDIGFEFRALYKNAPKFFEPEKKIHRLAFSPLIKIHFGYINNIDEYVGFGYGLFFIDLENFNFNNIDPENIFHGISFVCGVLYFYNNNFGILAEISIVSFAITIGIGISIII